jgi:hypothetical protein
VQIAGQELASLASAGESAWSGIGTVTQASPEKNEFGRSYAEEVNIRVPIANVSEGDMPDNMRMGLMFIGETTFKEWRILSFSRVASVLFTIRVGPLNG